MLTDKEKRFLRGQKIPFSKVFDATGLSTDAYQKALEGTEMSFVSGATPCEKSGHTLRTKSGHCMQCDTSRIAFQLRSKAQAHVYIAGSISGNLIKVGSSLDVKDRIKKVNDYKYGGYEDWKLLASLFADNSGRLEIYIHNKLKSHQANGSYQREGREQQCYELFQCDFDDAYKPLSSLAKRPLKLHGLSLEQARKHYSFR